MAAPAVAIAAPSVLADLLPARTKAAAYARDAVLVLGGAAAVGASAQIAFTIPQISPVPFVLTTFTVLLLGAAYGPLRAGLTLALYLAAGAAGVPWFTEGTSGFAMPTFGYIIGFLAASVAVGFLAKRGGDRTILKTVGLMVVGNVLMYAFGVPYLAFALDMSAADAVAAGMTPFLAGDAVKLVIAALLLPGSWALVNRFRNAED
ncbi:biotin transporter BioY [Glycomyces algeriensis]|uniref:Biotin transporter n=1 Tax=Glycomyces algeriensis TaxID=256037 RepID=A0A9W6GAK7_9ACTN|nr:biotin transporter BioY [Glycomyces algeriensis]MDA1368686.1 biotin transporter BioY [Glycomyces algeriensis]MDR7351723.1 biotin transport system substrate-specific component [Glycomyces algeriensis]GLI44449.1 biotin synthase [Glycomyces algeriensis]